MVKVLRVERLKTNEEHNGELVIHFRTYDNLFPSLAAAKSATASPYLKVRVEHGVAGKDFLEHNVQKIAQVPVSDAELGGYRKWRADYESGRAGVFPSEGSM